MFHITRIVPGFSEKQKGSSKRYLLLLAGIVLLGLAGVLGWIDWGLHQKQEELHQNSERYQQQVKELEASNADLKDKIANYENPEYIEKVAREEANMAKPGERVVSFIAAPDAQSTANQQAKPLWQRFWEQIIGFFK